MEGGKYPGAIGPLNGGTTNPAIGGGACIGTPKGGGIPGAGGINPGGIIPNGGIDPGGNDPVEFGPAVGVGIPLLDVVVGAVVPD